MSTPKILLLPSWYPSKVHSFNGIFIRRYAETICNDVNLKILYAVSSDSVSKIEIEKTNQSGFEEYIVYYPKIKNGIFSALHKLKLFYQAYHYGYEQIKSDGFIPDLVHVEVALNAGLFAVELKKKYKIPYVITEHWSGYLPEDGRYKGIVKKYFAESVYKKAEGIAAVSACLGNSLVNVHLTKEYTVIPNPVQTEIFVPDVNSKTPTGLIHVSNFAKEKNVKGILNSFQKLIECGAETKLLLVGEGGEKNELQNHCNENSTLKNRVEFLPYQTPQQLNTLINKSYALVLFSSFETMSIVMAEAWACGKPAIVPKVGGIPENFNSQSGILIEPNDENQLLEAMQRIITDYSYFDSTAIRIHALNKFSKNTVLKKSLDFYSQHIK